MLLSDLPATTALFCFHCGEACDDNSLCAEGKSFCCQGCQTVYELLSANNLCTYYDLDAHPGISFKKSRSSRFDYLDDESVMCALLQFSDGVIARTTFYLPQIHCTSCIWLLENLFKLNRSILRSEVNFLKKELAVTFRQQEVSLREVVELLAKLGYEPELNSQQIRSNTRAKSDPAMSRLYLKVGLAGFAFGNVMLFSFPDYLDSTGTLSANFKNLFAWLSVALATPVLLFSASDYFVQSWYAIRQRKISLDVPVALGIAAIYFRSLFDIFAGLGTGYLDSFTGLVFFLLIGKIFQKKTFAALSFDRDYASYFPLSVTRLEQSEERSIPVSKLRIGDLMFVRNRELVPADSVLRSASALIDYSFVTGESAPVEIAQGATVYAGGRVVGTGAELKVAKEVSHSYLTQLWNNEAFRKEKRSSLLDLSDAFGRYFTMIVAVIACGAFFYWLPDWHKALNAFTAVLIIACPCALTLAAPFTLGAAVASFGKAKFYLKNIGVVPDLAALNAVVFDKTGTLTRAGEAAVHFDGEPLSDEERAMIAACLKHSTHPLSRQILNSLEVKSTPEAIGFHETPGHGIEAKVNGHPITLGSQAWLNELTNTMALANSKASQVYVGIDGRYVGSFRIGNAYRDGLPSLLSALQPERELFLLSGDNDNERRMLQPLFNDERHLAFHQSPEDKLRFVEQLQNEGRVVAMIGDGLNDAGALQQSHVGIALTENTSAFSPACDAILDASQLARLPVYLNFARYALKVLFVAFLVSLVYNAIGLSFAVTGNLSPLVTAILMPVSSLTVVGVAWGAMKIREKEIVTG